MRRTRAAFSGSREFFARSSPSRWTPLLFGLTLLAGRGGALAQSPAPSLVDRNLAVRTAATGLSQPVNLAFLSGHNDMLVLEKGTGRVQRVVNGVVRRYGPQSCRQLHLRERTPGNRAPPELPEKRVRLPVLDGKPQRNRQQLVMPCYCDMLRSSYVLFCRFWRTWSCVPRSRNPRWNGCARNA